MWDLLFPKGGEEQTAQSTMDTIQNVAAVSPIPDMWHLVAIVLAIGLIIHLLNRGHTDSVVNRSEQRIEARVSSAETTVVNEAWKIQDQQARWTDRALEEARATGEANRKVITDQASKDLFQTISNGNTSIFAAGEKAGKAVSEPAATSTGSPASSG